MKKIFTFALLTILSIININAQTQIKQSDNQMQSEEEVQAKIVVNAIIKSAGSGIKVFDNRSLGIFSTGDKIVDGYIEESCKKYGIDPLLIFAQMKQESQFKEHAISYKGASGLMQLMPATARRFGVKNIYDPQQNIDAGVKYMRWLLDKFEGDLELALAGYNAGEGAVMKYGNQIPPYRETENYVAKIMTHYKEVREMILLPLELTEDNKSVNITAETF